MTDRMIDSGANDFADNPYESELCSYCGESIDNLNADDVNVIRYTLDGETRVCCERCFWGWIEEEKEYDEALMILRNRIPGESTGLQAIDTDSQALEKALEQAIITRVSYESAIFALKDMKGVA